MINNTLVLQFLGFVVVCTVLSGKALHRPVDMGIMVTSWKHMWWNGSTLARNARDVGLNPALCTVFPIVVPPMTMFAMTRILYKLHTVRLLNLPCLYICMTIACVYVIVSIRRLTIAGG